MASSEEDLMMSGIPDGDLHVFAGLVTGRPHAGLLSLLLGQDEADRPAMPWLEPSKRDPRLVAALRALPPGDARRLGVRRACLARLLVSEQVRQESGWAALVAVALQAVQQRRGGSGEGGATLVALDDIPVLAALFAGLNAGLKARPTSFTRELAESGPALLQAALGALALPLRLRGAAASVRAEGERAATAAAAMLQEIYELQGAISEWGALLSAVPLLTPLLVHNCHLRSPLPPMPGVEHEGSAWVGAAGGGGVLGSNWLVEACDPLCGSMDSRKTAASLLDTISGQSRECLLTLLAFLAPMVVAVLQPPPAVATPLSELAADGERPASPFDGCWDYLPHWQTWEAVCIIYGAIHNGSEGRGLSPAQLQAWRALPIFMLGRSIERRPEGPQLRLPGEGGELVPVRETYELLTLVVWVWSVHPAEMFATLLEAGAGALEAVDAALTTCITAYPLPGEEKEGGGTEAMGPWLRKAGSSGVSTLMAWCEHKDLPPALAEGRAVEACWSLQRRLLLAAAEAVGKGGAAGGLRGMQQGLETMQLLGIALDLVEPVVSKTATPALAHRLRALADGPTGVELARVCAEMSFTLLELVEAADEEELGEAGDDKAEWAELEEVILEGSFTMVQFLLLGDTTAVGLRLAACGAPLVRVLRRCPSLSLASMDDYLVALCEHAPSMAWRLMPDLVPCLLAYIQRFVSHTAAAPAAGADKRAGSDDDSDVADAEDRQRNAVNSVWTLAVITRFTTNSYQPLPPSQHSPMCVAEHPSVDWDHVLRVVFSLENISPAGGSRSMAHNYWENVALLVGVIAYRRPALVAAALANRPQSFGWLLGLMQKAERGGGSARPFRTALHCGMAQLMVLLQRLGEQQQQQQLEGPGEAKDTKDKGGGAEILAAAAAAEEAAEVLRRRRLSSVPDDQERLDTLGGVGGVAVVGGPRQQQAGAAAAEAEVEGKEEGMEEDAMDEDSDDGEASAVPVTRPLCLQPGYDGAVEALSSMEREWQLRWRQGIAPPGQQLPLPAGDDDMYGRPSTMEVSAFLRRVLPTFSPLHPHASLIPAHDPLASDESDFSDFSSISESELHLYK